MTMSVARGAAAVCTDCVVRWMTHTWSLWSKPIASALDALGRSRLPEKSRARASAKRYVHRSLMAVRQARNLQGVRRRHLLGSYTRLRLSQAADKGLIHGANHKGMTAALNTLSIGAHEAAQGSGA